MKSFSSSTIILMSLIGILAPLFQVSHAQDNGLLCAVNRIRVSYGLKALGFEESLEAAAQNHSNDMANSNSLDHTGSDGSSPSDRMYAYSGGEKAENIACGSDSIDQAMEMWMNSPGHRANILDPTLTHIGCGIAQGTGQTYFTTDFGGDGQDHNFDTCPSANGSSSNTDNNTSTSAPQPGFSNSNNSNSGGGSVYTNTGGGASIAQISGLASAGLVGDGSATTNGLGSSLSGLSVS